MQRRHPAGARCRVHMLHLHRLQGQQRLASGHPIAHRHLHRHDAAGHAGAQLAVAGTPSGAGFGVAGGRAAQIADRPRPAGKLKVQVSAVALPDRRGGQAVDQHPAAAAAHTGHRRCAHGGDRCHHLQHGILAVDPAAELLRPVLHQRALAQPAGQRKALQHGQAMGQAMCDLRRGGPGPAAVAQVQQQRSQRGGALVSGGVALGRQPGQQTGQVIADEGGAGLAGHKHRMRQAGRQKRLVGGHAQRHRVGQPGGQLAQRLGAVGAVRHQLGDHRVVVRRDVVARPQRMLHPQRAGAARWLGLRLRLRFRHPPGRHHPALRHELLQRVLGTQPHLDGMAGPAHLVLPQRQRVTGGHAQLPVHQIEPGDGLGHRVLHLQPGVHLHEKEVPCRIEQKLQRAGALVADGQHRFDGQRAHALTQRDRDHRRRRLLDQFLVPALHRAIALAQVDGVAVAVGKHLDLDVARCDQRPLQDHRGIAKRALRLTLRTAQRSGKPGRRIDPPQAAAATAGSGFDHHRPAEFFSLDSQPGGRLVRALVAGDAGHTGGHHQGLGAGLVAHGPDGLRRRADENQPGVAAGLRKSGVLGQKAVARVHRVGAAQAGRVDDRRDVEVALARCRRTDAHRLVGLQRVAGVGVGGGIHRHRAVARCLGAAHHAQRDLAPVGDQDFGERCHARA